MDHASRSPTTGRSTRIQAVGLPTCLILAPAAVDSLASRLLPRRCSKPDRMGHIRLECCHRSLPHHGTASHALGNEPETREETCRHFRAWCRRICPCLLASQDYFCYNGKFRWCYRIPSVFMSPRQGYIYLTLLNRQDPVHGAQLAGEWGTREAFVSVIITNLPMIFPLLKSWLKPLFGSALSSTGAASKHPSGFRTIGGGDGSSRVDQRHKPASSKQPITDNLSFSDSAEHIVNSVKMQNLEGYTGLSATTRPPSKGIMVSNEFKMVEDGISHNGDRDAKQVHESW